MASNFKMNIFHPSNFLNRLIKPISNQFWFLLILDIQSKIYSYMFSIQIELPRIKKFIN